jgi:tripartite-type tricarboxylate transporter receptor subunit TctC
MARLVGALLLSLLTCVARAETFPSRPMTLFVPFAAGGPADVVARTLASALGTYGQVIVENVNGAGGNIASARVAHATPDGYTLLFQNISMAVSPALYAKLDYDPLTDFDYVGLVAYQPNVVLARPDLPAKNFSEFVAYLKANRAKLSFANAGTGGASHLCALLFLKAIDVDMTMVPYRGTVLALTDLLGGNVDLLCDSVATAPPYIAAGKVRAFGVTSKERWPLLPDVPSLQEEGLAGFDATNWTGLYAPKNTPAPVLERLSQMLKETVADPAFKESLARVGSLPVTPDRATPQALQSYLKQEIARWSGVIKTSQIRIE